MKSTSYLFVSHDVPPNFCLPEDPVGIGQVGASAACMVVPEATVDEDHYSRSRQDNIGCAGQTLEMKSKSVPMPIQELPGHDFRLCVALPDATHQPASLSLGEDISHVVGRYPQILAPRPKPYNLLKSGDFCDSIITANK